MATEHFHQSQLDLIDTENFFSIVLPMLDERARRLVVAAIAGYKVCRTTVDGLLRMMGYTIQSCKKALEHCNSPDRDVQFKHIALRSREFIARRCPVISVDTKKKELIGNFKNAGRDYRPMGNPAKSRNTTSQRKTAELLLTASST